MRDEIVAELIQLRDEKYRDFHSRLCPGTANIIGVRIPLQRKVAQRLVKSGDWHVYLTGVKNTYYEETMIEGVIIATVPIELNERLELLKKFVPKIDNWAICDSVVASLKLKQEDLAEVWQFIIRYAESSREFEVRFMLVMMLDHFINDVYVAKIVDIIPQIASEDYYVKMALVWLVAEIYIKYPTVGQEILEDNQLTAWTHNKAIQKIRESYRVDAKNKEALRQLKR